MYNSYLPPQLAFLAGVAALLAILIVVVAVSTIALRLAAMMLKLGSIPTQSAFRIAGISTLVHLALRGPIAMAQFGFLGMSNGRMRSGYFPAGLASNELAGLMLGIAGSQGLWLILVVLLFTAALINREITLQDRFDRWDSDEPRPQSVAVSWRDACLLSATHYAIAVLLLAALVVLIIGLVGLLP